MDIIKGENISFSYQYQHPILKDITFNVKQGEFVAILGANGSGKSTLIKHLNALLTLQKGKLSVMNLDVSNELHIKSLRKICGIVFQNPDTQFVSSVIEEDIAFGLRNYDVPEEDIPSRVNKALSLVGMEDMKRYSPHYLSGGQKQRIALAGVLVMEPDIIIFDEATSQLDPQGRQEVLSYLKKMHKLGKTIIMVTHYVEEAIKADTIWLMNQGQMIQSGTPRDVLTNMTLLQKAQLMPPLTVQIYYDLLEKGMKLDQIPLTNDELVEALCRLK